MIFMKLHHASSSIKIMDCDFKSYSSSCVFKSVIFKTDFRWILLEVSEGETLTSAFGSWVVQTCKENRMNSWLCYI